MDEQSKAALELLVRNGYLESVKGKYRCTAKLNQVKGPDVFLQTSLGVIRIAGTDWQDMFVKFIIEAQVPRRAESSDGGVYDLNKYSADAMKHFKELMTRDGIRYDLLVKVTQAYYKGPGRYKKTISNYILEGIWRMDYLTLIDQSAEQQQQTLQKQMDDPTTFTRDRIG